MFWKRKKKIKKTELLNNIQKEIEELNKKYEASFNQMMIKAEKGEELDKLVKNIKFKVKNAKVVFDGENGLYGVKIEFVVPQCLIYVSDGQAIRNDLLYSISKMNMLSFEEMGKLQDLIDLAKKKSKEQ